MRITVLGTRGEIPESLPYHSRHSGLLVDNDLLIDVGEERFLSHHPRWILVSHYHPDHAFFVRRGKQVAVIEAPIYGPERIAGLKSSILTSKKRLGPYTVVPIPTHHAKYLKSQAYLIKKGGRSFLYTSDLVWIDKKYHSLIGQVDLVITEASFVRKGGMVRRDSETGRVYGHNGVPDLLRLLEPFSKKFLFTHFGSWFYQDSRAAQRKLKQLGREYGIEAIAAYDGMTVTV